MEVRQFAPGHTAGTEASLFDSRAVDGVRPLALNPYDSIC